MTTTPLPLQLRVLGRRLLFALGFATLVGLLNSLASLLPAWMVVGRAWIVGAFALAAFSLFEQWPRHLPPWLARWVLQLLGVVVWVPMGALCADWLTTGGQFPVLASSSEHGRLALLTVSSLFFAPWIALGAMVRQRDALARTRRSPSSSSAANSNARPLDARLRLLQAQVAAALPVQHAGQRAGAGRYRLAAGVARCCAA